jgi:hypothetical protein
VRPFVTSATIRPIVPATGMADGYEAFGGMRIGSGNRTTRNNPGPVPLCPPQIPHDLTWYRTRAAAVRSLATNHLSYGTALRGYILERWVFNLVHLASQQSFC